MSKLNYETYSLKLMLIMIQTKIEEVLLVPKVNHPCLYVDLHRNRERALVTKILSHMKVKFMINIESNALWKSIIVLSINGFIFFLQE